MTRFTQLGRGFLGAAVLLSAAAAGAQRHPCYRIGFENSLPYQFVDESGGPAGPAVELIGEAASRAGVCLTWVLAEEGPDAAVASRKVDLWPLVGNVGDRTERFHISLPWRMTRFWLVSRRDRPVDAHGDMAGVTIAHGSGTVVGRLASSRFPAANLVRPGGQDEAVAEVCAGQADAAITQDSAADLPRSPIAGCEGVRLQFRPLPGAELGHGIGASYQTTGAVDAADAIRAGISELVADGTVASVYYRWFRNTSRETLVIDQVETARTQAGRLQIALGVLVMLFLLLVWQTRRVRVAKAAADRSSEEARRASQAKSRFLSTMSHEIRTPLNGVLGMASLLETSELNEKQREQLNAIQQSGGALLTVIDDILDFSKIEAGKLELEEIDLDLAALTESVHQILSYQAVGKRLRFQIEFGEEAPRFIRGDPAHLRQVLLNLVGNALKFTERGSVMVKCEPDSGSADPRLLFEIADTGPGISPEVIPTLFRPYQQGDASMARRFGGTGLGLVISRQLVEQMGGEIGCRNNPGGGATFWFSLPLVPGKAPEVSDDVGSAAPSTVSDPRHVLVVEDDAVSRTVAVRMLERIGLMPDSAENGAEAVELASRRQYPLILMDCRMPDVDGFEAARRIRTSEPNGSHTVIIALTASTLAEDRQACIDAGMDDYLSKPIELATLADKIHRWLPRDKVR